MMTLATIRKALAAIAAALGVIGLAIADGHVTLAETGEIVAALAGVVGVFGLRNATLSEVLASLGDADPAEADSLTLDGGPEIEVAPEASVPSASPRADHG